MKIKYVGYSPDLSHPADRRRVALVKNSSNFEILNCSDESYDLLVLSGNANFCKEIEKSKGPVVIDLVDGYLNSTTKFHQNVLRNLLRTLFGKSRLRFITYTSHIRYALSMAEAVIVPSIELAESVRPYCKNVFVIPDDHSELRFEDPENTMILQDDSNMFMWEGFGSNLKHLFSIAPQLDILLASGDYRLIIVSQQYFYRWGNALGKTSSLKQVRRFFPVSAHKVDFFEWTLEDIKRVAKSCKFSIIPISEHDPFAALKSENKLLSAWTMSLPAFVTPTGSYSRMLNQLEIRNLEISQDWLHTLKLALEDKRDLKATRRKLLDYTRVYHSSESLREKWQLALTSVIEGKNA
jgi:hypothetical protein